MSAGLEASTVTPGKTPPEASLTTPVIVACAKADEVPMNPMVSTVNSPAIRLIENPLIAVFSFVDRFVFDTNRVRTASVLPAIR